LFNAGKVALSDAKPLGSGPAELEIAINARLLEARVSKKGNFLIVRHPCIN
jgi:hypothetical protein